MEGAPVGCCSIFHCLPLDTVSFRIQGSVGFLSPAFAWLGRLSTDLFTRKCPLHLWPLFTLPPLLIPPFSFSRGQEPFAALPGAAPSSCLPHFVFTALSAPPPAPSRYGRRPQFLRTSHSSADYDSYVLRQLRVSPRQLPQAPFTGFPYGHHMHHRPHSLACPCSASVASSVLGPIDVCRTACAAALVFDFTYSSGRQSCVGSPTIMTLF